VADPTKAAVILAVQVHQDKVTLAEPGLMVLIIVVVVVVAMLAYHWVLESLLAQLLVEQAELGILGRTQEIPTQEVGAEPVVVPLDILVAQAD
jgi:hypothetical protein